MFFVLFCFWVLMYDNITLELCAVGAVVCGGVYWLALRFLPYSPKKELEILKKTPAILAYLIYLLGQVALANLQVMKRILRPGKIPPSVLRTVKVPLKGQLGRFVLATSITLTPGTITAAAGEDGKLHVCALDASFARDLPGDGFVARLETLEGGRTDE